ncbi:hypothetical protein KAZ93_01545 [Patescibacteria group bacterium]|nr:hypothetical protein [Patescibacteria group bacterium]
MIVKEHDCGTQDFLIISKDEVESYGSDYEEVLYGRVLADDLFDVHGNTVLHK